MDQFLDRFEEVSETAPGAGFYKGLMTAMITLGAFIGNESTDLCSTAAGPTLTLSKVP